MTLSLTAHQLRSMIVVCFKCAPSIVDFSTLFCFFIIKLLCYYFLFLYVLAISHFTDMSNIYFCLLFPVRYISMSLSKCIHFTHAGGWCSAEAANLYAFDFYAPNFFQYCCLRCAIRLSVVGCASKFRC